jgi:hypothetical protein
MKKLLYSFVLIHCMFLSWFVLAYFINKCIIDNMNKWYAFPSTFFAAFWLGFFPLAVCIGSIINMYDEDQ